ncbi:hypothetical protein [Microbacterium sp.]|uniref:hypothetical protein n=1 Tax=Microbacterium sp. TaxID=51671 RepID=UPI0027367ECE|nr:hypothetical protein [Microbacterium sp.]MDP3951677.1 hypothetical protein [Microbacterium sp.]
MAGVRAAVTDSMLSLTEVLAFGLLAVVFVLVWFTLALVRVIVDLPAALGAARKCSARKLTTTSA